MNKFSSAVVFFACAVLAGPPSGIAGDVVQVQFDAAVRDYCHVVRFPSGWHMPEVVVDKDGSHYLPPKFGLPYDFEVRVSGLLGTRFLVRGVEKIVNNYYTSNVYDVDFSDQKGVARAATDKEWNSATVIAVPRGTFDDLIKLKEQLSTKAGSRGLETMKSGDKPDFGVSISPDRSLFVIQSWTGTLGPGGSDVPGDFSISFNFGRNHGKLFFDVYNADTGKKLIGMIAKFVSIRPDEAFNKTGWITERYFFIPLDERRERCLVCEFGRKR